MIMVNAKCSIENGYCNGKNNERFVKAGKV